MVSHPPHMKRSGDAPLAPSRRNRAVAPPHALSFVSVNRLSPLLQRIVGGRGASANPIRAPSFPPSQNAHATPCECSPIDSVRPFARWLRRRDSASQTIFIVPEKPALGDSGLETARSLQTVNLRVGDFTVRCSMFWMRKSISGLSRELGCIPTAPERFCKQHAGFEAPLRPE